jgi:hypothetical protein
LKRRQERENTLSPAGGKLSLRLRRDVPLVEEKTPQLKLFEGRTLQEKKKNAITRQGFTLKPELYLMGTHSK